MPVRRLEKARRQVTYVIVSVATLLLASLILVVLILLPYSPITVYDYTPVVSPTCLKEPVITMLEYELDEDSQVNKIEVTSFWVVVDVPGVSSEQSVNRLEGTIAPFVEGEVVMVELVGARPPAPGVWDAKYVTVLPEGDPECKEQT
jgi:hypothetical protein